MNIIKLTDITGKEVEIDATVIASKIEEISEKSGLGCSEIEWLIDSIKNFKENYQRVTRQKR